MAEYTSRLSLPLLASGQAQKEVAHNEALTISDMMIQPVVQAVGVPAPPPAPFVGQSWIVGTAPNGAWAGQANALAGWTPGGWRFITPQDGFVAYSVADNQVARFVGGAWALGHENAKLYKVDGQTVVKAQQPAIANPLGGTMIDAECRIALSAILQMLRDHGLIAT
jgi:hypothetical protein